MIAHEKKDPATIVEPSQVMRKMKHMWGNTQKHLHDLLWQDYQGDRQPNTKRKKKKDLQQTDSLGVELGTWVDR